MRLGRLILLINILVFAVSFALTVWIGRNAKVALVAGTVSVAASYLGAATIDKRRLIDARSLRSSLYSQIQELEQEEDQLYHSLYETTVTKQQIEASIHNLNVEYDRLRLRISELHTQRSALFQNIGELQKQHQQQAEPLQKLQQHIEFLKQRQTQVKHSLELKTTEVQQTETKLSSLRSELEVLQRELTERNQQQEIVNKKTLRLEAEKKSLEQQIEQLQERVTSLERSMAGDRELISEALQRSPILHFVPEEWTIWIDFFQQLSDDEKIIFQAILEQNEDKIKQVADRKTTMPEVLIEALNENAIQFLGDTVFSSNSHSIIPEIHEEYAKILSHPIQFGFQDLLNHPEQAPKEQDILNYNSNIS